MLSLALAIVLSIPLPSVTTVREQAARVADSYQPQAPTVRYTYNVRCVTTVNGNGEIESHRCGL